ncbi:RagB/SusD family nutrient uptake outer membrane protein [Sphingobacterium mizutaii]|uniref:RagB/SusD family nutrient uptake outer membrane protein n=1 Tax=Sphingobacterium mizutaii TaxID=1010 RepID=UPI003D960261
MKRFIYIGLFAALTLTSCKDEFLDRIPLNSVSEETFWKTENDVYLAVNGIYATLPSDGIIYEDGASDIAHAQYPWESTATSVSSGIVSTALNAGWNYEIVRKSNYFLENVDKATMDEALKNRYKAEVRFLRAYRYFNMASKFGGVPLITKVLGFTEEELNVPRASKDEVISFVLKELDEVANILPNSYAGGKNNEKGRITKGAVLALKSRILLNEAKYAEAAAAAQEVMGLGYQLFKTSQESEIDQKDDYSKLVDFANADEQKKFRLALRSYEGIFHQANEGNSEVILERQYIQQAQPNYLNTYLLEGGVGGWSSLTPTQELVNSYQNFKTGEAVAVPSNQERAQRYADKDKTAFLQEYKNRDPRFYASILFETAPWNALTIDGGYKFSWVDGASNMSKTGYNFRKMVDTKANRDNLDNHSNVILIRYAEVLLNYAEAKNEATGPDATVYAAIDQIRERAGMPKLDRTKYGSKEALRNAIRQERKVELALEGVRYLDIRRWKTAPDVMKNIYNLKNSLAQERIWDNKLYLMPVPQSQMDLSYGVLVQNPDY